jgi:hypothetical protein
MRINTWSIMSFQKRTSRRVKTRPCKRMQSQMPWGT